MSYTLHLGDCIEGMKALADKSVDHVICDPPYEAEAHTLQRRTKAGHRGGADYRVAVVQPLSFDPITSEVRSAACEQFARIARRWVITFCQAEAVAAWRDAMVQAGLTWKRSGIWIKPDGMPQLTGDRPGMGYESIAIAHAPGKSKWNGGGKHGVWSHHKSNGGEPLQHPTQKPESLMARLVADFTDHGDLILDPFAGSGTTAVAAIRLGRRFIGFERDPKYHAVALKRLAVTREQLELFREGA